MNMRTCLVAALLYLAHVSATAQTGSAAPLPATPAAAGGAKVIASGTVPDATTRSRIIDRLTALYGEGRVVDKIEVGGVLPSPQWTENVEKILTGDIRNVHDGKLQINGTRVSLKGNVATTALRDQIAGAISTSVSPGYTLTNGLAVADARQDILDQTLSNRIIEFESGSANLTSAGKAILDEMATAMQRINTPAIRLIGHTDNAGNRQSNLELSLARANAVRSYLVDKGIPATSLSTSGAGPDSPIRSNDTPAGRAQNRRIEFRFAE
ncbi:MAG: OmpA family protein [Proteobacteria bacterium]|nr:OmpA family protein [Pseudomonadota bacterium]